MRYLFGLLVIVAGIAQIAFRARTARANAAANNEMFSGRFSGPGWVRYNTRMAVVVGCVFVIFGLLMIVGVFGPVH